MLYSCRIGQIVEGFDFQMNVLANARYLLLADDPQVRLCSNLNRLFFGSGGYGRQHQSFVRSVCEALLCKEVLLLFSVLFFRVKKEGSGEIKIEMLMVRLGVSR